MLSSFGAPHGRPAAPAGFERDAGPLSAQPRAATAGPAAPRRRGARRPLALGALLAAVALLHAGLLHGAIAFAVPRLAARTVPPMESISIAPRTMVVRLLASAAVAGPSPAGDAVPSQDVPASLPASARVSAAPTDADAATAPAAPFAPFAIEAAFTAGAPVAAIMASPAPLAAPRPRRPPVVHRAALPEPERRGERSADGSLLRAVSISRAPLAVPGTPATPVVLEAWALSALPEVSVPLASPVRPVPMVRPVAVPADNVPEPLPAQTVAAAAPASAPVPAVKAPSPLPDVASVAPGGHGPPETPGPHDGADVPVYRTRLPPAVTLAYELRRGALAGSGELTWQPQGERYELRLDGRIAGLRLLGLQSRGTLDADGIAPVRYTDERRGRGTLAANFQRLAGGGGKITYSGPSTEIALPRGAQDRVTWLVQLAAIAAADPARAGPGGEVSMFVSGARADADVWTFMHVRAETLDVGGTPTPTLRLVREPRHAYDTRVDVWLDPARHFLPVRARLANTADGNGNGNGGEAFELMLRE